MFADGELAALMGVEQPAPAEADEPDPAAADAGSYQSPPMKIEGS